MLRAARLTLLFTAAAWALGPQVHALPAVPAGYDLQIDITETVSGSPVDSLNIADFIGLVNATPNGDGSTTLDLLGSLPLVFSDWTLNSWDSTYKPDPFVTNNFQVVNNTGVTQTYNILVTSPVAPTMTVDEIIQSNVLLQINDDDNSAGATLTSAAPDPIYQGLVNGVTELTFFSDPYSLSCTDPFDCAVLGNGQDATGIVSQAFGPVSATSIGIRLIFTLTPGDSASVQSRFEVVPEPAVGMLVIAALLVGFRRADAARRS